MDFIPFRKEGGEAQPRNVRPVERKNTYFLSILSTTQKRRRRGLAILDQLKGLYFFSFYGPVRTVGYPLEKIKFHRRPFIDQEKITILPFISLMLTVLFLISYLIFSSYTYTHTYND